MKRVDRGYNMDELREEIGLQKSPRERMVETRLKWAGQVDCEDAYHRKAGGE